MPEITIPAGYGLYLLAAAAVAALFAASPQGQKATKEVVKRIAEELETPSPTLDTAPPTPIEPCPEQPPARPPKTEPPKPPIPWIPWKPERGKTHPDHFEEQEAEKENSDDCGAISYAIDVLVRNLRFRRWDMQRQPRGGDKGHRDRYYNVQKSLKRLVEWARALGCPYNPEADAEITRPHSYPTPFY